MKGCLSHSNTTHGMPYAGTMPCHGLVWRVCGVLGGKEGVGKEGSRKGGGNRGRVGLEGEKLGMWGRWEGEGSLHCPTQNQPGRNKCLSSRKAAA